MSNTLIIIPTYNEKDNIEKLIGEIFRYSPEVNVLVVDDDSPDGTGAIAEGLSQKDRRVAVLHRIANRGRGFAGVDGFKEAVKRDGISYVVEMDGDFSHDPKYIPRFLEEIKKFDVVIGSRYVDGAKDSDRGPLRIVCSRIANFFLRRYLGLDVKDCSSGYRCFRRKTLVLLGLDGLTSKGPAIIEEILYKCKSIKCSIGEIPIVFNKRSAGMSKLGVIKLMKVFMDVLKLHDEENKELRKFGFSLGLGLNIVGFIMFIRHRDHFIYFSSIGSCALVLAILCPMLLTPLKKILDKLIFLIGWLTNMLTLLVAFYLIFAPIGLLLRVFGKDALHQRIDKKASSYWLKRKNTPFSKEVYERMG